MDVNKHSYYLGIQEDYGKSTKSTLGTNIGFKLDGRAQIIEDYYPDGL